MIINAILSGGTIVEILQAIVFGAVAVLLSISVHEWAHAVVAYMMGDYTQKSLGRMTLNPIKHLNPIGMIMFLLLGFGWANPVMMDSRNFKRPKLGIILTALAGPFANFLSGFIWLLIYVILFLSFPDDNVFVSNLCTLLNYLVLYNLSFGFFNLIPIPPLDGSKVVAELLPNQYKYKYLSIERYSMYIFFALIIILNRFNFISALTSGLMTLFLSIISAIVSPFI
jgi:Zn-dependent protease